MLIYNREAVGLTAKPQSVRRMTARRFSAPPVQPYCVSQVTAGKLTGESDKCKAVDKTKHSTDTNTRERSRAVERGQNGDRYSSASEWDLALCGSPNTPSS